MSFRLHKAFAAMTMTGLALTAMPREAVADGYGYVCRVGYVPGASPFFGQHGYGWASYYTEPACNGSYLTAVLYTSTGSSGPYVYTDIELQALVSNLARAANAYQRVYVATSGYVEFQAN